ARNSTIWPSRRKKKWPRPTAPTHRVNKKAPDHGKASHKRPNATAQVSSLVNKPVRENSRIHREKTRKAKVANRNRDPRSPASNPAVLRQPMLKTNRRHNRPNRTPRVNPAARRARDGKIVTAIRKRNPASNAAARLR